MCGAVPLRLPDEVADAVHDDRAEIRLQAADGVVPKPGDARQRSQYGILHDVLGIGFRARHGRQPTARPPAHDRDRAFEKDAGGSAIALAGAVEDQQRRIVRARLVIQMTGVACRIVTASNAIESRFRFEHGRIVEQQDECDERKWAEQAFGPGPMGWWVGRFRPLRAWKANRKLRPYLASQRRASAVSAPRPTRLGLVRHPCRRGGSLDPPRRRAPCMNDPV
jgi:hypothetical protein